MSEWNQARYQEIANRGLQDQLTPERKARFDEAVKRGLIQVKGVEEKGFFDKVGEMFTGSDRETRATRELPELESAIVGGDAAGFLSTLPTGDAAILAAAIATTSDPAERAKMLQSASPDFGIQYDEKGNIIAANNKTGQRVLLNAPGLSAADLFPMFGRVAASIPLGATGAPLAAAAKIAGAEGAITAGAEALQASQGGDFDVSNVVMDAALGGVSELIPRGLAKYSESKTKQSDELAQAAIDAEAGRIQQPLSAEAQAAQSNELASEIVDQSRKRKQNLTNLAGDVMPDTEVVESAGRLGVIDELTPGMISQNPIYKDIEGALRAKGGSELSVQGENAIAKVAQTADDLITEFGGDLDKAGLSEGIKARVATNISDLGKVESKAYDEVAKYTTPNQQVDMSDIYVELQQEAENLGGSRYLEPFEKRLLSITESGPSYSLLDKERKKIGAALHQKQGAYKDMDTGRLKRMYGMLTDAQEKSLSDQGLEAWNAAKAVTIKRKGLEEASQKMFGKNLTDALTPKVGNAMRKLSSSDYKSFDELMAAIPDREMREQVVLSSLNDVFTGGSRKEKQMNIPGFVDWYESLKRQPALMKRIDDNLPSGATKRLNDIYNVTKAMRDANARVVKTGVAAETLKGFDQYEGMLSKIYNTGKRLVAAEGFSSAAGLPGAGTASVITETLTQGAKEPATVAADRMIAGSEFKRLAVELAKSNFRSTQATKAAEAALKKSERYKKWYSMLPSEDKLRIIRGGLTAYFGSD